MTEARDGTRPGGDPAPSPASRASPLLRDIPVELIQPNPDQPRKRFDQDSIAALARRSPTPASSSR